MLARMIRPSSEGILRRTLALQRYRTVPGERCLIKLLRGAHNGIAIPELYRIAVAAVVNVQRILRAAAVHSGASRRCLRPAAFGRIIGLFTVGTCGEGPVLVSDIKVAGGAGFRQIRSLQCRDLCRRRPGAVRILLYMVNTVVTVRTLTVIIGRLRRFRKGRQKGLVNTAVTPGIISRPGIIRCILAIAHGLGERCPIQAGKRSPHPFVVAVFTDRRREIPAGIPFVHIEVDGHQLPVIVHIEHGAAVRRHDDAAVIAGPVKARICGCPQISRNTVRKRIERNGLPDIRRSGIAGHIIIGFFRIGSIFVIRHLLLPHVHTVGRLLCVPFRIEGDVLVQRPAEGVFSCARAVRVPSGKRKRLYVRPGIRRRCTGDLLILYKHRRRIGHIHILHGRGAVCIEVNVMAGLDDRIIGNIALQCCRKRLRGAGILHTRLRCPPGKTLGGKLRNERRQAGDLQRGILRRAQA